MSQSKTVQYFRSFHRDPLVWAGVIALGWLLAAWATNIDTPRHAPNPATMVNGAAPDD